MTSTSIPRSVILSYPAKTSDLDVIKDLNRHRHALATLVTDDIRQHSASGPLSWAWGLAHPVMLITVYAVVFSSIMPQRAGAISDGKVYVVFICLGMFPWLAFTKSLQRSASSLKAGRKLLRCASLPLSMFPAKTVIAEWLLACGALGLILALAPAFGVGMHWTWLLAPIPMLVLAVTTLGLAITLSVVGGLIDDTPKIIQLLMPLLMWSAPIVYAPEILPDWAQSVQAWHPLTHPLHLLRELVIGGTLPALLDWALLIPWPIAALGIGLRMAARWDGAVRDVL